MFTLLPRKLVIVLIFFFALGSLGLWYLLSFSPPQNVTVTDIKDTSAVVTWNTVKPSTSNVYYSSNPLLLKFLPLSFLLVHLSRNNTLTTNHRVVLSNLSPSRLYYLSLSNWFHFYTTQRLTFTGINNSFWQRIPSISLPVVQITDNSKQITVNSKQITITGIVTNNKLQPISGALVLAKTLGQTFSTLTDSRGNFSFNLNLSGKDHLVFFTAQNGVSQQKNIIVAREILKQPVLITLP